MGPHQVSPETGHSEVPVNLTSTEATLAEEWHFTSNTSKPSSASNFCGENGNDCKQDDAHLTQALQSTHNGKIAETTSRGTGRGSGKWSNLVHSSCAEENMPSQPANTKPAIESVTDSSAILNREQSIGANQIQQHSCKG